MDGELRKTSMIRVTTGGMFLVPIAGGRWRIDWQRTKRGGCSESGDGKLGQHSMSGKSASAFITLLTFLLASSATAQQHPTTSAASIPQREPITEDLSHGATFTFKVIREPYPRDEYGNPHTTVREVQVFRGDSKQPVQSLEDCELSDMEPRAEAPSGFVRGI